MSLNHRVILSKRAVEFLNSDPLLTHRLSNLDTVLKNGVNYLNPRATHLIYHYASDYFDGRLNLRPGREAMGETRTAKALYLHLKTVVFGV